MNMSSSIFDYVRTVNTKYWELRTYSGEQLGKDTDEQSDVRQRSSGYKSDFRATTTVPYLPNCIRNALNRFDHTAGVCQCI